METHKSLEIGRPGQPNPRKRGPVLVWTVARDLFEGHEMVRERAASREWSDQ